jgi:hypothetical protein
MKPFARRLLVWSSVSAAVLAGAGVFGVRQATSILKDQVEQALGSNSEVARIDVGWSAIELHGLRVRAPKGWPTEDALRAERVVVKPDLRALFSAKVHVPGIVIERAYVSAWRTRDGKLRLLPGLVDKSAGKGETGTGAGAPSPTPVRLGTIELKDSALEFFDSSVRQPAHKTRLEQLHARVEDIQLPDLSGRTAIMLEGVVKGVQRDGRLTINGWSELASRDSDIATRLSNVDLLALQPYLIKASETGVRRGSFDLSIKSTVRKNRLHAPGTLTLTGLELAASGSAFGTFMGVPRQAAVAALKNRKDQIKVNFSLDGNLDDPQFSLNESFMRHIGTSVAESLGISFESLARGVGSAADGLGGAVMKLFGK